MEKKPILAPFTCQVLTIVTGVIAAGGILFNFEAMKMNMHQTTAAPGLFEAAVVAGATILAGEVVGYFTANEE